MLIVYLASALSIAATREVVIGRGELRVSSFGLREKTSRNQTRNPRLATRNFLSRESHLAVCRQDQPHGEGIFGDDLPTLATVDVDHQRRP